MEENKFWLGFWSVLAVFILGMVTIISVYCTKDLRFQENMARMGQCKSAMVGTYRQAYRPCSEHMTVVQ
jgi:hypothetical protein